MANNSRRRLSFVDFTHPQSWQKLIEYADVSISFAKLSKMRKMILLGKTKKPRTFFFSLQSQILRIIGQRFRF